MLIERRKLKESDELNLELGNNKKPVQMSLPFTTLILCATLCGCLRDEFSRLSDEEEQARLGTRAGTAEATSAASMHYNTPSDCAGSPVCPYRSDTA